MLATLRPTLFQCMVRSPNHVYDLRRMFTNGSRHPRVENMQPRVPGSLGQDMDDPHSGTWVIGSLTMRVLGYSVFVFGNGKVKISGGSKEYSEGSCYKTWLSNSVIGPVMDVLNELNEANEVSQVSQANEVSQVNEVSQASQANEASQVSQVSQVNQANEVNEVSQVNEANEASQADYEWDICLLNGSMYVQKINEYKTICQEICGIILRRECPFFVSATMPVCFQPNGWMMKRGRVCSIALHFGKPSEKKGRLSTVRFDHGGRVQFFALKSMEQLQKAGTELTALLEPIIGRNVDHVRQNQNRE